MFNILFLILFIFFILSFFVIIIHKRDAFAYPITISFVIIFLLSILSFKFPLFSFLFVITISSFIMFMSLPYKFLNIFQEKLLSKTLLFLYHYCLLDFIAVIHIKFFSATTFILFLRFFIIFSITLFHIFFSRWYFLQSTFLDSNFSFEMQIIIIICLFIGIAISFFRFLLSFSLFILPLTLNRAPWLLSESVLYVFGENPDQLSQPTSNTPTSDTPPSNTLPSEKKFSFINVNLYRNHYRQYYSTSTTSFFKYAGFCIGFITMSAAVITTYYSKEQAQYSKEQAQYSKEQAYETRREADVAAVEAGLITKEEYWRRHPQDYSPKPKD